MKVIIFNNPSCSKCRSALAQLKDSACDIEVVEYLKNTPKVGELKKIIRMLGIKPEALIRKKESLYKEKFEGKSFSDAEWIKIMVANPILIERPILIRGNSAIIGREEEKVDKWLNPTQLNRKK